MNCHLRYIGVVDTRDHVHFVEFRKGVNVVTGRSSTGKSAMIEIFDYCLGSSDFTVPDGVITSGARIFFVVLAINGTHLVLARRNDEAKGFVKEETAPNFAASAQVFTAEYFDDQLFLTLSDFRKEIGRFFGLVISDIDESAEEQKWRGSKSPTPSVRSFASFMLQHQNLVANKHAVFYRFDEKEKREQAIEHLPVFLGYADQRYYLLSQQLNSMRFELRRLQLLLPREEEEKKRAVGRLQDTLNEYVAVTGAHMVSASAEVMLLNPAASILQIRESTVRIDGAATEFAKQRAELDRVRSIIVAELRRTERRHDAASSSVRFAEEYRQETAAINVPTRAMVAVSECPFCHSTSNRMEEQANLLQDAIEWLNEELRRSAYLRQSFEADEAQLAQMISSRQEEIRGVERKIGELDSQIEDLNNGRPLNELAIRAKVRAEAVLEDLLDKSKTPLEMQIADLVKRIDQTSGQRQSYGVAAKLQTAQVYIEDTMLDLAGRFDFEESYRPVRLRFSLESFDLWHEKPDGSKVFLRAMGSGANWLYCHLCLFLALHKLFCKVGDGCMIPPILFLDQPSQVYFPSLPGDDATEFKPKDLAEKGGRPTSADEDILAVENMYTQLVRFCEVTKKETGIEPQIIVTDHADKLKLGGDAAGVLFESLVRARWRTRGFIDPVPTATKSDRPSSDAE